MDTQLPSLEWRQAKRLHDLFCENPDGEKCDVPWDQHGFLEWWLYAAREVVTGLTVGQQLGGLWPFPPGPPGPDTEEAMAQQERVLSGTTTE